MAGYQDMANALLALLRAKTPASSHVTANNSNAKSDWDIINAGQDPVFIITPADAQPEPEAEAFAGAYIMAWEMEVHCIAKLAGVDDETVHDNLVTPAQAVIDTIDQWPKLDATAGVFDASQRGWAGPNDLFTPDGRGPHAMSLVVQATIREDVTFTPQE